MDAREKRFPIKYCGLVVEIKLRTPTEKREGNGESAFQKYSKIELSN
jgi:hypothetical protein